MACGKLCPLTSGGGLEDCRTWCSRTYTHGPSALLCLVADTERPVAPNSTISCLCWSLLVGAPGQWRPLLLNFSTPLLLHIMVQALL